MPINARPLSTAAASATAASAATRFFGWRDSYRRVGKFCRVTRGCQGGNKGIAALREFTADLDMAGLKINLHTTDASQDLQRLGDVVEEPMRSPR